MELVINVDKLELNIQQYDDAKLNEVLNLTRKVFQQGVKMASEVEGMRADLAEANVTTNEIADDVTALLNKLADGGLTKEETASVRQEITNLNTRLKGVAAQYPANGGVVDPPPPPPIDPNPVDPNARRR